MIRRLKRDVLTLLEPTYYQIPVELHPSQREIYDQVDEEMRLANVDPNAPDHIMENALTEFLRLKQICGSPATMGYPDESYKLDEVISRAREVIANGERLVVFTQFRGVLECVTRRLFDAKIPYYELHGDVDKSKRQDLVRLWSTHPTPSVIVCMLQVAGVGLNMTASRTAFFVDKLFVPGLNQQAVDRLHRIGQQVIQPVEIYEFIARRTVESRVEQILRTKRRIFDNVIEGTGVIRAILKALRDDE